MARNKPLRILFPIGDREVNATEGRILRLLKRLADDGHSIDLMTCMDDIFQRACDQFAKSPNIKPILVKREERFWTMTQRDSFAKAFIALTHDMILPGTDMKYWKLVGFDDFLWNVSPGVYPPIEEKYDLVLKPIPSLAESPSNSVDALYTQVIHYAKHNNIPLAGIQVYPSYDVPPLYPYLMDHFIVSEPNERGQYLEFGVSADRIHLITDLHDGYCMSTIQDVYKNLMFEKDFVHSDKGLYVAVVNNGRNRTQIYDIIDTISSVKFPKKVFFCLLNYAVKELHENDIFNDLIKPRLEKGIGNYGLVESGGLIKALMMCDVILSTSYIVPLSFAKRYEKKGVVYNPLLERNLHVSDIDYVDTKEALSQLLRDSYREKQSKRTFGDAIKGIMG